MKFTAKIRDLLRLLAFQVGNQVSVHELTQMFYKGQNVQSYFWRTYTGAEIDYIEEWENGLMGFEIKISKTQIRPPKLWGDEYNGLFQLINRGSYLEWLLEGMG